MESLVRHPNRPAAGSSSLVRDDPLPSADDRVGPGGRRATPTSMPAAYCPHCSRMVATVDGRRITHQIRFNEGWCKGNDSALGHGPSTT